MTQQEVARAVFVQKSVVSMWENAERGLSFEHLDALDRCYGAGGALAGTALVMGTPAGLPARTSWVHNPIATGGAVWVWCRPPPGRRRIAWRVGWGGGTAEDSASCDEMGVFVTSPVSRPDPPVRIELSEPGWVDFGRGVIPIALDIPVFPTPFRLPPHGSGPAPAGHILDLTDGPPDSDSAQSSADPQRQLLRKARCLSRREAAKRATSFIPHAPISGDQIATLEQGGDPRPPFLRSRLDRVYEADGYTCLDQVTPRWTGSRLSVDIPAWWIGPVWFTFSPADGSPTHVELRRGGFRLQLLVGPNTTVACRKPTADATSFEVFGPSGLTVTAGMGVHSRAWNVEQGWATAG